MPIMDDESNYCVDVIGFNPTERLLLQSIFGLAKRRDPSFVQREPDSAQSVHLYLVDSDDEAAMKEFRAVHSRFPAPSVLVGATEFFGGLLIAVGFLTRPAAVAATILLAVAVFKVHMPNGFFNMNGGYEYAMLWGFITLAVAFRGGGALSVDRAIGREF